jgi:hypothetical protein
MDATDGDVATEIQRRNLTGGDHWRSPDDRAFGRAVRLLVGVSRDATDQETIDAFGWRHSVARPRPCEHQRLTVAMVRSVVMSEVRSERVDRVFWCRDCGALGEPGDWRLPGEEP